MAVGSKEEAEYDGTVADEDTADNDVETELAPLSEGLLGEMYACVHVEEAVLIAAVLDVPELPKLLPPTTGGFTSLSVSSSHTTLET